jgi:hypothetical protein
MSTTRSYGTFMIAGYLQDPVAANVRTLETVNSNQLDRTCASCRGKFPCGDLPRLLHPSWPSCLLPVVLQAPPDGPLGKGMVVPYSVYLIGAAAPARAVAPPTLRR